MTPSHNTAQRQARDFKPLRTLFARAKRRAWLLVALQSASHALAVTVAAAFLLASVRSSVGLSNAALLVATILFALAITLILTIRRAKRIPDYLRCLDDRFDAAGRIISAGEFIDLTDNHSPFHALALADTAEWIAKRPTVRLPWTWPTRWAALCAAFALLASTACQKPQPTAAESTSAKSTGKIKVEQPDPGDHLTRQPPPPPPASPPGSNGSNGMFGPPAERPSGVTYGTQVMPADHGFASSGGSASNSSSANRGAAQPNGLNSGSSSLAPSASNNSGVGTNPGPNGQKPAAPSQKPGQPAPNAPPGGSMAGRGPGQKQSDPRGVSAARKDVAAIAKKGEGNGGDANKLPGERKPGKEFAQGGPAASSQPAGDLKFDGVELDEMAIERLPPEQRERVRQYNANLRRLRQTTQPHGS